MATKLKLTGLCSTCRHRAECTLRRPGDSPKLECEEHDVYDHAPTNWVRLAAGYEAAPVHVPPTNGLLGLCADCAHRDACTLPKPEGGVWRCEEYC